MAQASAPRQETFVVQQSLPGERLDKFLALRYPAMSRGAVQRLLEEGFITVNDQRARATHAPRAGDRVSVTWPEARPATAQARDIPLAVLHEDEDLLVLNKAPGMVVHPASGHEQDTLVNALLHHCRGRLSGIGGVARPGIVHRLDKDTSGCLVVAKTDAAHAALAAQFAARTMEKTYLAILCGDFPRESGEIRARIARHPTHRKSMIVTAGDGREAWTTFRVAERLGPATLMEVRIHTGRTHQIRVHFKHLGFPVAGDDIYGARQSRRLTELTAYEPPRLLLHAHKLAFVHPRTRRRRVFTAPWPADFQQALRVLRALP